VNAGRLPSPASASAEEFCDELFAFLTAAGQSQYDETVTQLEHALQTAAIAERQHRDHTAQVAALLHDIGHLALDEHHSHDNFLDEDLHHETVGARYLTRWFGPGVGAPVALHVKAKRYLVAADPAYASRLSAASTRSLQIQGGPMTSKEIHDFLRQPHADLAIALRRWDDNAKEADAQVPGLDHWRTPVCAIAASVIQAARRLPSPSTARLP
jgi:phosphonate degradation associated HDIG domain protein